MVCERFESFGNHLWPVQGFKARKTFSENSLPVTSLCSTLSIMLRRTKTKALREQESHSVEDGDLACARGGNLALHYHSQHCSSP